jgi:hypothetical protein
MDALARVYKACIYCLTHPFFLTWRITPLEVHEATNCTMCELKAYIYQQCRHRGPASTSPSQLCQSNRRCLTETDPFDLELVLQEQPGFCPDCESCAEATGEPLVPYVPPRVGDILSAHDLKLGPLELEATAVGVKKFRQRSIAAAVPARARRNRSPTPDTTTPLRKTPLRRRRYTDGDITPSSSAFRLYIRTPIHHRSGRYTDDYNPAMTPTRASQGSLPETPMASSPPQGQKRSYAAANQSPIGRLDSDEIETPEPRLKRPKSSSSASSGKSSSTNSSDTSRKQKPGSNR